MTSWNLLLPSPRPWPCAQVTTRTHAGSIHIPNSRSSAPQGPLSARRRSGEDTSFSDEREVAQVMSTRSLRQDGWTCTPENAERVRISRGIAPLVSKIEATEQKPSDEIEWMHEKLSQLEKTCTGLRDELSILRKDVFYQHKDVVGMRSAIAKQEESCAKLPAQLRDERDSVITEVHHASSTLFTSFSTSLTEHTTRLVDAEQNARSQEMSRMREEIIAVLEDRICSVIRQERVARLQEMSEMHSALHSLVEREIAASVQSHAAALDTQSPRSKVDTRTPSQNSRTSELETVSDESNETFDEVYAIPESYQARNRGRETHDVKQVDARSGGTAQPDDFCQIPRLSSSQPADCHRFEACAEAARC